jgi:hypothetical protein
MLEQLNGAQVSASYVENEEGLHICFADGRILVICGWFAISLLQQSRKELH